MFFLYFELVVYILFLMGLPFICVSEHHSRILIGDGARYLEPTIPPDIDRIFPNLVLILVKGSSSSPAEVEVAHVYLFALFRLFGSSPFPQG